MLTLEELKNDASSESDDKDDVEAINFSPDFPFEYLEEEQYPHGDTTVNGANDVARETVV
ncbi:hypothetical protein DVH05_011288 [Phytophthora capsici]|nr:hypothetical protein DVH05_011288 [Phytophthora capsici]